MLRISGPNKRIYAGELHEREDGLLDREVAGPDLRGEPQLLQRLAHHHQRGQLGQWAANGLGDEGHRARRARVHLDDVDLAALDRVLHVHQAVHTQLEGQLAGGREDLVDHVLAQRVRRQRAGAIARVNARLLDVLHHPADHHALAVAQRVHVHLGGVRQEAIHQNRMLRRGLHREAHVVAQRLLVANDLHGSPAQHVGRTDQDRVADAPGHGLGLGVPGRLTPSRRFPPPDPPA